MTTHHEPNRSHFRQSLLCAAITLVAAAATTLSVSASDPPAFSVPVPAGFDNIVLFAEEKIDLKKDVTIVSGDLIGNGEDSEIKFDKDGTTAPGYSVKAEKIELKRDVVTNGTSFFCSDLDDETGQVSCSALSLPVYSVLPAFLNSAPGSNDVDVDDNGTVTLAPGAYKKLDAKKNSTIILTGGVYDFEEFQVDQGSDVLFQGPTVLKLKKKLDAKKNVYFGPDVSSASPPTAADIRIYIQDDDASFDQGSEIRANLYIADGKADLKKNIDFTGAILATEIQVDQNSTFTLDTAFRNLAPVAVDDGMVVAEGSSANALVGGAGSLLANDSDPNGDGLSIGTAPVGGFGPTNGTVVVAADGTFVYTHNGSETTVDSFVYEVCDDGVAPGPLCSQATVSIAITPVNDAPIANPDSITVDEGSVATQLDSGALSVLANDTDAEGNALSATAVVDLATAHGSVDIATDGTFSYTHDGSETLSDAFTYEVCDNGTDMPGPLCSVGTVSVAVNPVNDAPVAITDALTLDEGGTSAMLDGGAASLLDNDTDVEGNALSATAVVGLATSNGNVDIATDGTFSYAHDGSETLSDTFSYEVCDDGSPVECSIGNVNVVVNPINDAPVANPQTLTTEFAVTVNLTGSDAEGDTLTFSVISGPNIGSVGAVTSTGSASAEVVYTPSSDPDDADLPLDGFTFQVDDGNGGFGSALVTINLVPPNSPPVTVPDVIRTSQGGTATTLLDGANSLLANDFDPEGGPLSLDPTSPVSGPSNGTVVLNSDGTFSYTHAGNGTNADSFVYRACDSGTPVQCANATVTVQVFNPTVTVTLDFTGPNQGTVTSSPAGLSCTDDCAQAVSSPDRIVLTATAASGFAFAGFGGDADCSDGELLPDGDKACTVTFNEVVPPPTGFFNLTVSKTGTGDGVIVSNPAGITCDQEPCPTVAFPAFTRIELNAIADPGSVFVNWNGTTDCLDGLLIRLPDEDASCVAVFDAVVVPPSVETLTVTAAGQGTVVSNPSGLFCSSDTCSADFATGTQVLLQARRERGGSFLGWSGDAQCVGVSPLLVVTMDAGVSCTANFSP